MEYLATEDELARARMMSLDQLAEEALSAKQHGSGRVDEPERRAAARRGSEHERVTVACHSATRGTAVAQRDRRILPIAALHLANGTVRR
ncbi:hypothetical protein, partial [Escherichia coli]|uniref:hypothetical protein n=1 Tax=Escherichia coli TaxID=562 RepID=UPI00159BC13F